MNTTLGSTVAELTTLGARSIKGFIWFSFCDERIPTVGWNHWAGAGANDSNPLEGNASAFGDYDVDGVLVGSIAVAAVFDRDSVGGVGGAGHRD